MDYRLLADAIAADIAEGRLRPGDRLPPQRDFAHRRGIAASTAGRAYAELRRRGLIAGEVGRGTYVRLDPGTPAPAPGEPPDGRLIDLELVVPILPEQPALLAEILAGILRRPEALGAALRPVGVAADAGRREAAAAGLARGGWRPAPEGLRFAGNGRQALAGALAALAPPGARVGFEALTYPVAKAIAVRLGIVPVPLAMDAEGLRPDALEAACRSGGLAAVYLQPTLHNPLGPTMPEGRRQDLAAALRRLDLIAVEDAVYAFLEAPAPAPLAAFAPERVILVDSLSKRVAPGITLGFVAAPPGGLAERAGMALRTGAWSAGGLALDLGLRLLASGAVARLEVVKREDAAARQRIALALLAGLHAHGTKTSYHLWLDLPAGWRAEAFAAAALRAGVAVTPAAAFAVGTAHAPQAVRLALAAPSSERLREGLEIVARLARHGPGGDALD